MVCLRMPSEIHKNKISDLQKCENDILKLTLILSHLDLHMGFRRVRKLFVDF